MNKVIGKDPFKNPLFIAVATAMLAQTVATAHQVVTLGPDAFVAKSEAADPNNPFAGTIVGSLLPKASDVKAMGLVEKLEWTPALTAAALTTLPGEFGGMIVGEAILGVEQLGNKMISDARQRLAAMGNLVPTEFRYG